MAIYMLKTNNDENNDNNYYNHNNQKNYNSTTTTTTTGSSTTSTTTTLCRNSSRMVLELETIKSLYFDCIGRAMPSFIVSEVKQMLEEEIPSTYMTYALRQTAYAPRPSWSYTAAIIRRLIREGVPPEDLLPF